MNSLASKVSIGTVSAIVGLWFMLDPWPVIGWVTPNQYNEDMSVVTDFRDEWKCDEWDEELRDLLKEQAAGNTSTDLAEDIRRLRQKMDKLNCGRFDD